MVRNGPNSLRGSVSTLSLRAPQVDDANDSATKQRFAELEADLAALRTEMANKSAASGTGRGATTYDSLDLPLPPQLRFLDESTPINGPMHQILAGAHSPSGTLPPILGTAVTVQDDANPSYRVMQEYLNRRDHEERNMEEQKKRLEVNTLFEKFNEAYRAPRRSLISKGLSVEESALKSPEAYCQPFCDFLTENPTVFHAVDYIEKKLEKAGFKKVRIFA